MIAKAMIVSLPKINLKNFFICLLRTVDPKNRRAFFCASTVSACAAARLYGAAAQINIIITYIVRFVKRAYPRPYEDKYSELPPDRLIKSFPFSEQTSYCKKYRKYCHLKTEDETITRPLRENAFAHSTENRSPSIFYKAQENRIDTLLSIRASKALTTKRQEKANFPDANTGKQLKNKRAHL